MSAIYIPLRFRPPAIPHTLIVTRLYRRALRECQNHYFQRLLCRQKQLIVRENFDKFREETNPKNIERLVMWTEECLKEYAHPQPYVSPCAPDGSKWERNLPVPEEMIKKGVTLWDNSSA